MGGLFGGDMEMIQRLLQGLGVGSAEAAGPPGGAWANTGGITPEQLLGSTAATNPLPPSQFDPNSAPSATNVPPGMITPTINPTRSVLPTEVAAAPLFNDTSGLPPPRLGLPGPVGNPDIMAPGAVGAAFSPPAQGPTPSGEPLGGATDIGGRAKTGDERVRGGLADALKGVTGPKPPELQRISSPNAPRPTGTIRGGDLQALLLALNAGAPALDRKLPMTLGQGIGRG